MTRVEMMTEMSLKVDKEVNRDKNAKPPKIIYIVFLWHKMFRKCTGMFTCT